MKLIFIRHGDPDYANDTSHLDAAGIKPSDSGFFDEIYTQKKA